jgi:hypothetical protein
MFTGSGAACRELSSFGSLWPVRFVARHPPPPTSAKYPESWGWRFFRRNFGLSKELGLRLRASGSASTCQAAWFSKNTWRFWMIMGHGNYCEQGRMSHGYCGSAARKFLLRISHFSPRAGERNRAVCSDCLGREHSSRYWVLRSPLKPKEGLSGPPRPSRGVAQGHSLKENECGSEISC